MKVGFIGLGTMGASIALNAIKGQNSLVVHDINRNAADPHLDIGANWADSPKAGAYPNGSSYHSITDGHGLGGPRAVPQLIF